MGLGRFRDVTNLVMAAAVAAVALFAVGAASGYVGALRMARARVRSGALARLRRSARLYGNGRDEPVRARARAAFGHTARRSPGARAATDGRLTREDREEHAPDDREQCRACSRPVDAR